MPLTMWMVPFILTLSKVCMMLKDSGQARTIE